MLRILLSSALITPARSNIPVSGSVDEPVCPTYQKNVDEFANLGNGNFAMPENRGIDFFIEFVKPSDAMFESTFGEEVWKPSEATFDNTFGVYFEDDKCNPLGGKILYKHLNPKNATLAGPAPEHVFVDKADVPQGATQFGYFIIPNGGDHSWEASKVEFKKKTVRGKIVYQAFETRSNGKFYLQGPTIHLEVVFTKAHLNPGNKRMVDGSSLKKKKDGIEGSEQELKFEDGGDDALGGNNEGFLFDDVFAKVWVKSEVKLLCENQQSMCGNNGYCRVEKAATKCKCNDGYAGEACEKKIGAASYGISAAAILTFMTFFF